MAQALAVKYRPQTWDDVVEQSNIKIILQNQLENDEIKNAYLFVGGAGTGKTTCARIFANEINKGEGSPIELDAASNNGVDDVRSIIQQAKTKSLDSEYKIFILDECHALSNNAWQAMLKLIEEPPAKSIFIFCTTNPEKIPKTILSRVQRYDFQRISQGGIVDRLKYILGAEANGGVYAYEKEAVEYIAKIADGGMRDAISLMDKCLAFSNNLTVDNVILALGTTDYGIMMELTNQILKNNVDAVIGIVEDLFDTGKDIKQFVKQYMLFLLDVNKYSIGCDWKYIQLPKTYSKWVEECGDAEFAICFSLLAEMVRLNADIKYSSTPKYDLEAILILFMGKNDGRAV